MIVNSIIDSHIRDKAKQDWFEYWLHYSHNHQCLCSEANCTHTSDRGVLIKLSSNKNKIFVIPLCKAHSDNLVTQLEISDNTEVIPANLTL